MATRAFTSVDHYIKSQPEPVHDVLELVRSTILDAVPGAEEGISYQIPCYKLNDRVVIFFAGWKEHFSLYPATDRVVETLRRELAAYEVSKGTIQIPLTQSVPLTLIERVAKVRAQEATEAELEQATKTTPKKKKKKKS